MYQSPAIIISLIVGSAFSIATSLQVSASVVCAVVSNEIYHPQITRNGHKNNAGIVFWVMAGSWALTLPLILYVINIHVHICVVNCYNYIGYYWEEMVLFNLKNLKRVFLARRSRYFNLLKKVNLLITMLLVPMGKQQYNNTEFVLLWQPICTYSSIQSVINFLTCDNYGCLRFGVL